MDINVLKETEACTDNVFNPKLSFENEEVSSGGEEPPRVSIFNPGHDFKPDREEIVTPVLSTMDTNVLKEEEIFNPNLSFDSEDVSSDGEEPSRANIFNPGHYRPDHFTIFYSNLDCMHNKKNRNSKPC